MEATPEAVSCAAAQRILAAAERLFGERGFNGVSIRDVAVAAGVSKANVFHHFSSKLALYQAVLQRSAVRFRDQLGLLEADGRSLDEALRAFDRRHLQDMLQQDCSVLLFLRQLLQAGGGEERRAAEEVVAQGFAQAVEALERFRRDGRMRADVDPAVLALTMFGGHLAFFLLRGLLADRGEPAADPAVFSSAMIDHVLRGIASG